MAVNFFDQFDQTTPEPKKKNFFDQFDEGSTQDESRGVGGFLKDTAIDTTKGVVGLGESAVGLADIATGNMVGKGLAKFGYDPESTNKILDSGYSPQRQEANQNVADAKGFIPTVKALAQNPSTAFGSIVESAPLSIGGVGVARGVATKMLSSALAKAGIAEGTAEAAAFSSKFFANPATMATITAAGAGAEGATTTGMIQEQGRQEGKGWGQTVLPAVGAGLGTAAIGVLSSKVPGFHDAEAALAIAGRSGERATILQAGKEIAKTMFKEGALEEMPQSYQEQVFTNLAMGKPWDEGAAESAGQGLVVGAFQGGGMEAGSQTMNRLNQQEANPEISALPQDPVIRDIEQAFKPTSKPTGVISNALSKANSITETATRQDPWKNYDEEASRAVEDMAFAAGRKKSFEDMQNNNQAQGGQSEINKSAVENVATDIPSQIPGGEVNPRGMAGSVTPNAGRIMQVGRERDVSSQASESVRTAQPVPIVQPDGNINHPLGSYTTKQWNSLPTATQTSILEEMGRYDIQVAKEKQRDSDPLYNKNVHELFRKSDEDIASDMDKWPSPEEAAKSPYATSFSVSLSAMLGGGGRFTSISDIPVSGGKYASLHEYQNALEVALREKSKAKNSQQGQPKPIAKPATADEQAAQSAYASLPKDTSGGKAYRPDAIETQGIAYEGKTAQEKFAESANQSTGPEWLNPNSYNAYYDKQGLTKDSPSRVKIDSASVHSTMAAKDAGRPLTHNQQKVYEYLVHVGKNSPEGARDADLYTLEDKGHEFHAPKEISADTLQKGDSFVVSNNGSPEEFKVIKEHLNGEITAKDGVERTFGKGEIVKDVIASNKISPENERAARIKLMQDRRKASLIDPARSSAGASYAPTKDFQQTEDRQAVTDQLINEFADTSETVQAQDTAKTGKRSALLERIARNKAAKQEAEKQYEGYNPEVPKMTLREKLQAKRSEKANKPAMEQMVAEAAKWKGAALKVAQTITDKRQALHHSKATTKGDLDAYLMKKFGIDEAAARSVSNALTQDNVPADMKANIEDFAGEPWATPSKTETVQQAPPTPLTESQLGNAGGVMTSGAGSSQSDAKDNAQSNVASIKNERSNVIPNVTSIENDNSGRFIVIERSYEPGRKWKVADRVDDIVAHTKDGQLGVKYFDTENNKWVNPGKKGPINDPSSRSQYQEVPPYLEELAGNDYNLTLEALKNNFKKSDDTFSRSDEVRHFENVRAAVLLGMDVPDNVRAELKAAQPESVKDKAVPLTEGDAKEKKKSIHDFSNTQISVTGPAAAKMIAFGKTIPDAEIYTDPNDDSYGRETTPHITVRYGLATDDPTLLKGLSSLSPIDAKFGEISIFENDKYDVVKVEIKSAALRAANKKVGELVDVPGETFTDYQPHATIAYVKKGEGKKYVGDKSLDGLDFQADSIDLTDRNNVTHSIKLQAVVKNPLTPEKATEKIEPTNAREKVSAETGDIEKTWDILAYGGSMKPTMKEAKAAMLEAIDEAILTATEPSAKDGFSNAETITWPKTKTMSGRKLYTLPGQYSLVSTREGGEWQLYHRYEQSGQPEKIGERFDNLSDAKAWSEAYLLGKMEDDGKINIFKGSKDKSYQFRIKNSIYALEAFRKKIDKTGGVLYSIDESISDRAKSDLTGITNAYQLLNLASRNGNDLTRALSKLLLKTISDEKLLNVPVSFANIKHSSYHPSKGITIADKDHLAFHSMLHEAVHGITVREMRSNPYLRIQVKGMMNKVGQKVDKKLMKLAKDSGGKSKQFLSLVEGKGFTTEEMATAYALSSPEEFLAQAFSSKSFQELLKSIPATSTSDSTIKNLWDKLVALVGKALGITGTDRNMLSDVVATVVRIGQHEVSVDYKRSGSNLSVDAWHGTPHKVDKFSSSKIGTGEGAQAYGYGLYFAGAKDVAEFYRKQLSGIADATYDGRPAYTLDWLQDNTPEELALRAVSSEKSVAGGRKLIEKLSKYDTEYADDYANALKWFDANKDKIGVERKGNLYQVELAPDEDEFLLWDKPLSEQSEKVKEALKGFADDGRVDDGFRGYLQENDVKGQQLYNIASKSIGIGLSEQQRQAAASEYLHSIGIRGVKYLDGTSRPIRKEHADMADHLIAKYGKEGAITEAKKGISGWNKSDTDIVANIIKTGNKEGDFNYVIFNEDDVKITGANGESLSATPDIIPQTETAENGFDHMNQGNSVASTWNSDDNIAQNTEDDINLSAVSEKVETIHRDIVDRITASSPRWKERFENFVYNWLNTNDPRKRIYASADKKTAKNDMVTVEELRGKKTADEVQRTRETVVEPMLKELAQAKLTVSDLEEYGHGLHASERNQRMREVRAKMTLDQLLSKMTDTETEKWKQAMSDLRSKTVMEDDFDSKDTQRGYLELIDEVIADIDNREAMIAERQEELDAREFTEEEIAKGTPERKQGEIDNALDRIEATQKLADKWSEESPRLSGMTDEEGQAIIDKWQKDQRFKSMQSAKKKLDLINRMGVEALHDSGELTDDEYNGIVTGYKHYVPLHREGFLDTTPTVGRITGPTGKPLKVAMGSMREVVNIVAHSVQNYETAVNRKHKAAAGKALYQFVLDNPDSGLGVEKVAKQPTHDKEGNVVMYPTLKEPDNGIFVKVQVEKIVRGEKKMVSEKKLIMFDTDQRTPQGRTVARFLDSIKGQDAQLGPRMAKLSQVNRYLAMINTMLSPEFVLSNFVRDFQTAFIHLSDEKIRENKGLRTKIAKDIFPAIKGIFKAESGNDSTDMGKWYRDFSKNGGKIGWMQGYEKIEDLAKELEYTMKLYGEGHTALKKLDALKKLVSRSNTAVENGVRLATYKNLVESGVSRSEAASVASKLTVDFTQKGKQGPALNALYMFANAGIQGNLRMIQAIGKSREVRKIVGGIVAGGFALQLLALASGGDDDSGEPYVLGIADFIRERNMIFMIPGTKGKYISIPMPYGYNGFNNIGAEAANMLYMAMTGRKYNTAGGAMRVMTTFANAFNPLASGTILQTLSPTIADPIVMAAENKNFMGNDLMPNQNPFGPEKPDSERYWKNVSPTSKVVTSMVNRMTGGDRFKGGLVDMSPETLDMLYDTVTGSTGKFVSNVLHLPVRAATGELEVNNVPFARRFTGAWNDRAISNRYYEAVKECDIAKQRYDGAETPFERAKVAASPEFKLYRRSKLAEKQLTNLLKSLKLAEARKDKERTETIKNRITSVQMNFLNRMEN